jgi:hopene-associated glycosyltransferase HpnB
MLTIAGVATVLIWIYLAAARGRFWQVSRLMATEPATNAEPSFVAVVIPARDEVEVVGRCVTSLLRQEGSERLHIFLVDDHSKDGTAAAARQSAEIAGKAAQFTIVTAPPLPAGWSGKLWAVEQGVHHARELNPDFLLLTDADIEHGPRSVATLASIARTQKFDMVSFMVTLYCRSLAERALVPAFIYFFFQLYPPAWVRSSRHKTAAAAGGSILVRPQALERAGGIQHIRGEIIDDCALARAVKRSGGRVWLGASAETRSVRPYGTFAKMGRMISRSAFNQLRHSTLLLLFALSGLTLTYLLPPFLVLFSGRIWPAVLGGAAWIIMAGTFLPMVRFYRLNPLWSLALPLIALFYMGATLHSAFRFWTGHGGGWKGRVQDPARAGH